MSFLKRRFPENLGLLCHSMKHPTPEFLKECSQSNSIPFQVLLEVCRDQIHDVLKPIIHDLSARKLSLAALTLKQSIFCDLTRYQPLLKQQLALSETYLKQFDDVLLAVADKKSLTTEQQQFMSTFIEHVEELHEKINYPELNPVVVSLFNRLLVRTGLLSEKDHSVKIENLAIINGL